MNVNIYNTKGEVVGKQELNPAIFGLKVKPELVQQAVVAQQARARQVLAHVKTRGEVRGGGRKPWPQKGTGRARHGSIRSPLWRGGGVTFGPSRNRNFSLKINKKAKRKALLMCLSDYALNQKIILLDKLELEKPKTKQAVAVLQNLKLRFKSDKNKKPQTPESLKKTETLASPAEKKKAQKTAEKKVLLVLPKKSDEIKRSFRNIPRLEIINADSLNVVEVLKSQVLLLPVESLGVMARVYKCDTNIRMHTNDTNIINSKSQISILAS